jgi:hypothetical protein
MLILTNVTGLHDRAGSLTKDQARDLASACRIVRVTNVCELGWYITMRAWHGSGPVLRGWGILSDHLLVICASSVLIVVTTAPLARAYLVYCRGGTPSLCPEPDQR